MRIAGSIILGVLGAILYFAVTVEVAGVSLSTVGLILLIAAGLWFLVELVQSVTGQRTKSTQTVRRSDGTVEQRDTDIQENREL